jgi:hypothetical protein
MSGFARTGPRRAAFAQQQVTCITAIDLHGRILWQRGRPDPKHAAVSSDIATQIYHLDGDGRNEVLVIEDRTLRILDGHTGQVRREHPVPANDSILIANFSGTERPGDLLIKDRYSHVWAFDNRMQPLWQSEVNCGHYPMNVDIDQDGCDELICGYRLYSHDGRVLWDHPEFGEHNDAVDVDDMDSDGVPEKDDCILGESAIDWRVRGQVHVFGQRFLGRQRLAAGKRTSPRPFPVSSRLERTLP